MAKRCRRRASALILLLIAACDRPREDSAPRPEPPPGTGVSLALLQPSDDMLLAALEGVLHVEGRCLYVVGADRRRSRTLPAFHIDDISWDAAARALRVRGQAFAPGDRVLLTGGEAPGSAALRWVRRPHPSCDSSNLFIAGAIDPAKGDDGRPRPR